ncbi:ThiJ/PfpI family protein [Chitinispirillum alkaliphilum]|nr:ThiJ/PfpI family protein [Chitinispirillum alkaliphilum]
MEQFLPLVFSESRKVEKNYQNPEQEGKMATIAVLVDNLFEDVEYDAPVEAFKNRGHKVVVLGLKKGALLRGKKGEKEVRVDMEVGSADPNSFDALFVPGGYSPDRLRAHNEPVIFTRAFFDTSKPIFLICHAPQLLISARLLGGRKITGWKSIKQDIKNAGAEFIDSPVVVDENLISSRGPADMSRFIETTLEMLDKQDIG